MPNIRTEKLSKQQYRIYLDKAEEFYKLMKHAQSEKLWTGAGLNGIHCAISACDALTTFYLGRRAVGQKKVLRYSYEPIRSLAAENGFGVVDFKIIGIDLHPEDLIRFYSIPHIGARRLPDKSPEERREIFTKAFSALSPAQFPHYRWAQFTLALSKDKHVSYRDDKINIT